MESDLLGIAREKAAHSNVHVVLEGYNTIVAAPDGNAYINTAGSPGMATGGSSVVLTGILAGLRSQFGTENWERALGFGVYLHGLARDLAAAHVGEVSLTASDVLAWIPAAWGKISRGIERSRSAFAGIR